MSLNAAHQDEPCEVVAEDRQPDAMWKKIQKNTFTRWVNQKLEPVNVTVTDLATDFEEGLKLISLVEVLSGKSLGRHSKKVTFRHQKLENISLALRFLEDEEHIKIVNIDSSAIADHNLKLILGLVWTLILHYSISKQVWDDHSNGEAEVEGVSPKVKLMTWLKGKLPSGLPFTNFTSDWNDGILLGALVDSCAPDLEVDWRNWLPSQALQSTRTAMQLAKDHLSIFPLIAPEELISPAVDEKSVMTYLAQFPGAKYTPPLGWFRNVNRTPTVGIDTKFVLRTRDVAVVPEIAIRGPDGSVLQYVQHQLSGTSYEFKYRPEIAGKHEITTTVHDNASGDSSQLANFAVVAVEGPRLLYDKTTETGKKVELRVENVGRDSVEVLLVTPGSEEFVVPLTLDGVTYKGEFVPKAAGLYEIGVFQKGSSIAGSPFHLSVISQAQIIVWGRGIEPDGVQVGDEVTVYADYNDGLLEPLTMRVQGPSGNEEPVNETQDENLHRKIFTYRPLEIGSYEVTIRIGEVNVGKSPYKVMISGETNSVAHAFGPGLEGGIANLPSVFFIETGGRGEQIGIDVSGMSLSTGRNFGKPYVELMDNKDGSAVAQFTPTEPGVYIVKVYVTGRHIKRSPFVVHVQPANNSLKIADMRLSGIKSNATEGREMAFKIEMPDPRVRLKPLVRVLNGKYEERQVQVLEIKPGQYECRFVPEAPGRYYFLLSVGGVAIPGSPFVVVVREMIDTSKIRIHGTGVGPDVHANQPVSFTIDPQNAGDIKRFKVELLSPDGTPLDIALVDSGGETLTVNYMAPGAGPYELLLHYDDMELKKMSINVKPVDVSSILVDGLDNGIVPVGLRKDIVVDTGDLTPTKNGLQVIVEEAIGSKYMVHLERDRGSGIYKGFWTAKNAGETKFSVYFDESLVRDSKIIVERNQDAAKCRAFGEGLQHALVGVPAKFQVDTQAAGEGQMKLAIKGPSESQTDVTDHSNGLCTVEYIPLTPGFYEISIYFGDKEEEIPGSPFEVSVDYERDPSKVLITGYNNGRARAGVPTSFIIDATHTARESISARLPVGMEQPIVEEIKPRVYRVTFTPSAEAVEKVPLEVLYGGQLLHERPMDFTIEPEEETKPVVLKDRSGNHLPSTVRASLLYGVLIDTSRAREIDSLAVELKGPDGKLRKTTLGKSDDKEMYLLEFIPDMAGTYVIVVHLNGKPLQSKPFELVAVPVGSANNCFVESKPLDKYWTCGEPKTFVVNASRGGEGALSIVADVDDLETNVEEKEGKSYVVTLTPHSEGPHRIMLMYGGIDIPNGALNFECVPPLVGEEEILLERSAEFEESDYCVEKRLVPRSFRFSVTSHYQFEKLSASVRMPSGKSDVAQIKDNGDGSVTVTYQPKEFGSHVLSIQHDGINMSGSPISFYVSEVADGCVTVYGPGLSQAVVGEPAPFTVCAKGSPAKELSVAVEGSAKATIKCHDNKDGTCSVAWVPPVPGEYKIHVQLSGKPVKGSPFIVFVAGEGQKRAHLSVGSTSEVLLNIANTEIKGLSASIKSPSGIEEPCFIRQIDSAHIGVSFTPREEGEHLITVKRNGRVIPKSPFRVKVDKSQVGDATKVVVSGKGIANAVCQQYNDVVVDTRDAGYGGLSVSVEGSSKAELKCTEAKEGLINIAYKPTEPGIYVLSIKFADVHIKGSPFTVNCTGKGLGAVKESAHKEVKQAPVVLPGQEAALYLQLENTSPMETSAKVMDPNGHSEDAEVRDLGDNFYQIRFRPEVDGPYAVSLLHRGQHVLGSPFQFTVGHMTEMGAHRVRAAGVGLLRAETNKKQCFNLYTREAGQGELEVTIEGPSKAELQFHNHKDGNCHFDYRVTKPGEYLISVKFNNEHIPDSPFKVFVAPATGEARRLELASFPDSGIPGKACTFVVLTHRAPGHLEAKVHTPSNRIETIDIVPIDEGESYALRFIPTETGNYYVDVTLDGAPMRDSPFRLRIGASEDSDPTAITVSGEGIRGGQTGQKCEFIINTCNAGTGLLQVQVDGPSKVTLDAYEMDQGYKVRYMALAPGAYYVAIKYSGVHIPGSPYKVIMAGKELGGGEPDTSVLKIDALAKTSKGTVAQVPVLKGDASKVTVKGAGLNKFFPGRPAMFNIDTALAGENLLFVGVLTSKGPCEEVTVRHLGNGQHLVTYRIQEKVKGFIFVKYGDTNVPGSPFAISF